MSTPEAEAEVEDRWTGEFIVTFDDGSQSTKRFWATPTDLAAALLKVSEMPGVYAFASYVQRGVPEHVQPLNREDDPRGD